MMGVPAVDWDVILNWSVIQSPMAVPMLKNEFKLENI
jgi:hypothetical protein